MLKKLIIRKIINGDDDESSNIIIPVPSVLSDKRKCERGNYIPHSTSYCNQKEWCDEYTRQLDDLYRIVGRSIDRNYKLSKIDWKDPKYVHAFDKLMFNCSSRYISSQSKDVDNEDKEWEKQKES
jgi:hypothetical protein